TPVAADGSTLGEAVDEMVHILRDQLCIDEGTFWAAVRGGSTPQRSRPAPPPESLPAEVAALLVNRVGLTREQVAALSRAEAIQRINRFWTEGA
ncbi:MAG TPA: hypothetical protein VFQ37_07280, partial [Mycobacterium sp.]|nr:hypothetical protein [Mycobacterium sp.]